MLLLALLLAAPASQEGPEKLFGDWVVACDNLHGCEMTSLWPGDDPAPEEGSGYDANMSVSRAAGPSGAVAVEIWGASPVQGRVVVRIDDAVIVSTEAKGESVTFSGADAARIAAAMPNGKTLTLTGGDGKLAARISLSGSSASLRFIDADQGRAGTVTALVARGAKPASTVPAAPPAPTFAAQRPSGIAASVSKALRATLEKRSECDGLYDGADSAPEVETFALGGGKTLVLLPCGAGAYNFSSVAFILAGGKAERAEFDDGNDGMLVNASFAKGELSTYAKGRGVGDCGASQSYAWDGTRFRLTEATSMIECRGSTNWLTTFRATPVFR